MENQNSTNVFSVPSYKGTTFNNGETNRRSYKTKNAISIIKQKIDSNLHLRLYKDMKCMVADLVKDTNAKPIALIPKELQDLDDLCSDYLRLGGTVEDVEKVLKS